MAQNILETGQSPNSLFPFLFVSGHNLETWVLDSGLSIQRSNLGPESPNS